jgi:C-terminal processing protease CtpA/Prc
MIGYKRIKSSVGLALYIITAKGFKSSYAWSYSPNLQRRPRTASQWDRAPSPQRRESSLLNANSKDVREYQNGIIPKMITKQIVASGLILLVASLLCFDDALAASDMPSGKRYWSIMESSESKAERVQANDALLDYAVGTINTQFYDNTGGNNFDPSDFYMQWRSFRRVAVSGEAATELPSAALAKEIGFDTREGAVQGLRWFVNSLNDPYSKYLTREELRQELSLSGQDGFLGIGAIVEAPQTLLLRPQLSSSVVDEESSQSSISLHNVHRLKKVLSSARVSNLPVVTAVEPDSPAERSGLVVGDRIVAVGSNSFLGSSRQEVSKTLATKYNAQSYFGQVDLTIAKPVYAFPESSTREIVIGYRPSRVHLLTKATESTPSFKNQNSPTVSGGDNIVHYQLLSSSTGSIFDHLHSEDVVSADDYKVGYIRLTRFSKASTNGYLHAVQELEAAGAKSYILDLRNNYGGTFQDALLLASTLIRDPHAVLCKCKLTFAVSVLNLKFISYQSSSQVTL